MTFAVPFVNCSKLEQVQYEPPLACYRYSMCIPVRLHVYMYIHVVVSIPAVYIIVSASTILMQLLCHVKILFCMKTKSNKTKQKLVQIYWLNKPTIIFLAIQVL